MDSIQKNISGFLVTVILALFIVGFLATPAQAATMTLDSDSPNRLYELKAKIKYLETYIEALRDGDLTPQPTFIVTLKGPEVSIFGTIARDRVVGLMELCGPTNKGQIGWGDGTVEPIVGLGCSGDVHTFASQHVYTESGNYKIRVEDTLDRGSTHNLAIRIR